MSDRSTSDAPAAPAIERPRTGTRSTPFLRQLKTGVSGLDAVLGGGLPEFSFNVLAGPPGAGKTTLAQQILFANATVVRPAIYFTVLGEPTVKMLRYQRQFDFFRPELLGSAVHYVNLAEEVLAGNLGAVLTRMTAEVERLTPSLVVVDSFRAIRPRGADGSAESAAEPWEKSTNASMVLDEFVQRLALHLTSWEVTSVLIGDYAEPDHRQPLLTVADGVLWLSQVTDRNSVVRKLQVLKVRGQAQMPGLHTFRITDGGLQVFPRIPDQQRNRNDAHQRDETRLSTGVPGLDVLMGGGIPAGDAVMLAGPTGTGKSTFGMLFAADGLRRGESVVVVGFEEYPAAYMARLRAFAVDPEALIASDKLRVTYLRPLDLSVDETLADILANVRETGATRVVIDSLTGFEIALAPAFREDFRESLYRLVGALTASDVTVFMTHEAVSVSPDFGFTGERVSFITDDILVQRYIEIDGTLEKVLSIVKMRRSQHSAEFWRYQITGTGAVMGEPVIGYHNILGGSPDRATGDRGPRDRAAGLTSAENAMLDVLVRRGKSRLDALAVDAGVPLEAATSMVQRLIALEYVIAGDGAGGTDTYHAVARASGP